MFFFSIVASHSDLCTLFNREKMKGRVLATSCQNGAGHAKKPSTSLCLKVNILIEVELLFAAAATLWKTTQWFYSS